MGHGGNRILSHYFKVKAGLPLLNCLVVLRINYLIYSSTKDEMKIKLYIFIVCLFKTFDFHNHSEMKGSYSMDIGGKSSAFSLGGLFEVLSH